MARSRSGGTARSFKATRISLGRVLRGAELTVAEAIAERLARRDVVVCDGPLGENRALAAQIERTVGAAKAQAPHRYLGPYALPHFQQVMPPPEGHTFYETDNVRAARNP